MKKEIKIFKRKVPVLAVMVILLLIGTSSAALIANYATLSGTYEVKQTVFVVGDNEANTKLTFGADGVGTFIILNTGNDAEVEILTTLYLDLPTDPTPEDVSPYEVTDVEGITISIDGIDLVYGEEDYLPATVQVLGGEPGINHVTVAFDSVPAVVPGEYTIQVEVNPPSTA